MWIGGFKAEPINPTSDSGKKLPKNWSYPSKHSRKGLWLPNRQGDIPEWKKDASF